MTVLPLDRAARSVLIATAFVAIAIAGGCSSAHMQHTWRDPSFAGPIEFKKTVALALQPDGDVRRAAEDEMVKQMGPGRAVAGYTIVTDDDRKNMDKMKSKLVANGVDGAVTMKIMGSHQQTTYVPGDPGYPGFYGGMGGMGYDPGYVVTDTIVNIQTNIYSVADGKLIWSGTSESFDPSQTRKAVADVAKAVVADLRKDKLLQ
jgi:hypothetical protein